MIDDLGTDEQGADELGMEEQNEYCSTTQGISVIVRPTFIDQRSSPESDHYFWAYEVVIHNGGVTPVQLRSRYWHITNADGLVNEVRGSGVVGEQPRLTPGESFEYVSGTPLNTPSGIMLGSYTMQDDEGGNFDVAIPAFSLDSPYDRKVLN